VARGSPGGRLKPSPLIRACLIESSQVIYEFLLIHSVDMLPHLVRPSHHNQDISSVYLSPEMSWGESLYFWLFARITRKIANPTPTTATAEINININSIVNEENTNPGADGSLWTAISQQTL